MRAKRSWRLQGPPGPARSRPIVSPPIPHSGPERMRSAHDRGAPQPACTCAARNRYRLRSIAAVAPHTKCRPNGIAVNVRA